MAKKTKSKKTDTLIIDSYEEYLKEKRSIINKTVVYSIFLTIYYAVLPILFFFLYDITAQNLLLALLPVLSLFFVPILFFVFYDYLNRFIYDYESTK